MQEGESERIERKNKSVRKTKGLFFDNNDDDEENVVDNDYDVDSNNNKNF